MKSSKPESVWLSIPALLLAGGLLLATISCSRQTASSSSGPVLSDPAAGLTVALPPSATSFMRRTASQDRFVSRIPYGNHRTLLYLHAYFIPLMIANDPPVVMANIIDSILRDELGSFLTLDSAFTNLTDQTPVYLVYGRARDPDQVAGFAFQCNKTHFAFLGLAGPDIGPADASAFFQATSANLHVAEIAQTSFVDAAPYQQHLLDKPDPAQSLDYIRNFFASRNANPAYYPVAIQFAFLLAQDLQRTDPASPLLDEALALLNNMFTIRLADYLKARRDFEVALGQRNAPEAIAQAQFLAKLSFPFDAEAVSLAKQRLRKAYALQ